MTIKAKIKTTKIRSNLKIGTVRYFNDIKTALYIICFNQLYRFDAIVCLKRSGFIMGAFLSNKMNLPLFTTSEIECIPEKYKRILLVDDKIWHGRQMRKYMKRLHAKGKAVQTLCLYIEGDVFSDFYVKNVGRKVNLFYERSN